MDRTVPKERHQEGERHQEDDESSRSDPRRHVPWTEHSLRGAVLLASLANQAASSRASARAVAPGELTATRHSASHTFAEQLAAWTRDHHAVVPTVPLLRRPDVPVSSRGVIAGPSHGLKHGARAARGPLSMEPDPSVEQSPTSYAPQPSERDQRSRGKAVRQTDPRSGRPRQDLYPGKRTPSCAGARGFMIRGNDLVFTG